MDKTIIIKPATKHVFMWLIKKLESSEYGFNITKAAMDIKTNQYYIEADNYTEKGKQALAQLDNLFLKNKSFTYSITEKGDQHDQRN